MDASTIRFEYADGIARLTLNRPDRLNAFSEEMFGDIRVALDRIEGDAALRVLVISGEGRGFCAGADLVAAQPDASVRFDAGAALERFYNPLIKRLRALPVPVLCAVNGVAAGAGVSLALAGDIVVATQSASFILAFARIGLVPDAGATWFLPQRIGAARAAGLALLGEKVSAADAAAWGLIWKCVADDAFGAEIERLVQHLAHAPTRALAMTKQALGAADEALLAQQLDLERDLQQLAGATLDFAEGVAAFKEKRPARFRGH